MDCGFFLDLFVLTAEFSRLFWFSDEIVMHAGFLDGFYFFYIFVCLY